MTRTNFLKDKRVLTFILLGITLVFGALAVFLAIAINNRNVNPDDTSAARSCDSQRNNLERCENGEFVDGNGNRVSCDGFRRDFQECERARACELQGQDYNNERCVDRRTGLKGEGEVCSSASECSTGICDQAEACSNPIRTCGRQTPAGNAGCNVIGGTPSAPATPGPTGGNLTLCEVKDLPANQSGCQPGQTRQQGIYCPDCKNRDSRCVTQNAECGQALPPAGVIPTVDSAGWVAGSVCRYRPNRGSCAPAQFRDGACNPGDYQMCFCRGEITTTGGWTYGSRVELGAIKCDGGRGGCENPETYGGGLFEALECSNPFKCPVRATPPPPLPTPSCKIVCDSATNRQITTCTPAGGGTPVVVENIFKVCNPGCLERAVCDGPDFVRYDCQGNEVSRRPDPSCVTRTPTNGPPPTPVPLSVALSCDNLIVRRGGQEIQAGASLNPGDVVTLEMRTNTADSIGSRYAFDDGTGVWRLIGSPSTSPNSFNDQINPRTVTFTIPSTVQPGRNIRFATSAIFKISPNGVISTQCVGGNCDTDPTNNVVACGGSNPNFFRRAPNVPSNQAVGVINPQTGQITQSTQIYVPIEGFWSQELRATCTDSGNCMKSFSISSVQPSVCTNISVTNTRTNQTCTSTNAAACANLDTRQGDTLNVSITGTGNITGYTLGQGVSLIGQTATSTTSAPQSTGSFTVNVPTNGQLQSLTLTGSTTNGVSTSSPDACRVSLNFNPLPEVDKEINAGGSVNLGAGNVVDSTSEVLYDITIRNNGNAILQNVIAVDRLTAFDPGNVVNGQPAPVNPPFGDIIGASNLARTTGSNSSPQTVAPRRVFDANNTQVGSLNPGNSYTAAPFDTAQITSVEWNRITALHPGEVYTGTVRVDISSFTNNPILRNTICLYNDANNNGQYDSGTDTLIRCDEVDVNTQQPVFTIEKEASQESVGVGNSLDYTVTLRNTSGNTLNLNNATVVDTLDPSAINGITVSNISNGGTLTNNTITWGGANLIQANGGNASLAPGATLELTFRITVDEDFFTPTGPCSAQMSNIATASSSSPNFANTSPTVFITVTRVCLTVTPRGSTPTGLPPSGESTPIIYQIIAVLTGGLAITVFALRNRLPVRFSNTASFSSGGSNPIDSLMEKIRIRK
jgi:hypothetical protein